MTGKKVLSEIIDNLIKLHFYFYFGSSLSLMQITIRNQSLP